MREGLISSIAAGLLLISSSPAHLADNPLPARKLCDPRKIKQTNAWIDCLQKAIDKSEAELAALVRKIAATMDAADMLEAPRRRENRMLFEATQQNWIAVRNDDCKAYGAHSAGLGFGAVQYRLECHLNETVSRAQTLGTRYKINLK